MTKNTSAKKRTARRTPKMGEFLDAEEKAIAAAIESKDHKPKSLLTSSSKARYEAIARATISSRQD